MCCVHNTEIKIVKNQNRLLFELKPQTLNFTTLISKIVISNKTLSYQ